MSIVWEGIIQCKSCKKYFEDAVSYFVDEEDKENFEAASQTRTCPYCKQSMTDWYGQVVYDPGLKENKMTREQVLKIQKNILHGL